MNLDRAALGPVRIAWAVADASATELDAVVRGLDDSPARRYADMPAARGRRFATGRRLLTELVVEAARTRAFRIESVCERCGGEHGRPRVEGAPYAVSVSYAGDLVVAAAVSLDSASAVGVDVEARSGDDDTPLNDLALLFSPGTPPGLREWTQIEAVSKADGRGLQIPPADITFGERRARHLPGGREAYVPGIREPFEVAQATGPSAHLISIAVAPPRSAAPPSA